MIRWLNIFVGLALLLSLPLPLNASDGDKKYNIAVKATYTSASRLFPNPDAIQEALRNRSIELNDVLGFGFEIRRQLTDESVEVGVGVEFLTTSTSGLASVPGTPPATRLPVTDGYRFVPVEFTGYFIVPFSSEAVKFFMGGGVGFYYGERIYQVVDRLAQTVKNDVAFGIHVLTGVDYFLNEHLSVRGELKFRDPQFDIKSKFTSSEVEHNGVRYRLSQQPFNSRVNLDGLVITLGAVINF